MTASELTDHHCRHWNMSPVTYIWCDLKVQPLSQVSVVCPCPRPHPWPSCSGSTGHWVGPSRRLCLRGALPRLMPRPWPCSSWWSSSSISSSWRSTSSSSSSSSCTSTRYFHFHRVVFFLLSLVDRLSATYVLQDYWCISAVFLWVLRLAYCIANIKLAVINHFLTTFSLL